jgi:hypothetical protein
VDKFSIAIEWNSAQDIVVQVLKQDLECLRADWNKRYNDQWGCGGIFTTDKQEDLEEISAHISAYKKIIKYYGVDTTKQQLTTNF